MYRITLRIDGMRCGMCEAHINDVLRRDFKFKKVSSNHSKGVVVILSETAPDEAQIKKTVDSTGYSLIGYECEPYEKRGFFSKK